VAPPYDPNTPHAAPSPYGAFVPAPTKGSKIAAVSLSFGIVALVTDVIGYAWQLVGLSVALRVLLGPLLAGSVYAGVAVALGHVALNAIRDSRGATGGRSLALAGLILGYIGLLIMVIGAVVSYFTIRNRVG
jgi:hypothetical protein